MFTIKQIIIDRIKLKLLLNLIITLVFSFIYWIINETTNDAFSKNLDYFQALYFSATTNFTLGFGDITPLNKTSRIFVVIHSILFYSIVII